MVNYNHVTGLIAGAIGVFGSYKLVKLASKYDVWADTDADIDLGTFVMAMVVGLPILSYGVGYTLGSKLL